MAVERKEWLNSFTAGRVEGVHDIVAAFFCGFSGAEYTLERTERFRMTFRRGKWTPGRSGEMEPVKTYKYGTLSHWPVTLWVVLQPTPQGLLVTVKHELSIHGILSKESVVWWTGQCKKETVGLEQYLAQVKDTSGFAPGQVQIETPTEQAAEPAAPVAQASAQESAPPVAPPPVVVTAPVRPTAAKAASTTPQVRQRKPLSVWWPASRGGTAALVVLMVPAFIVGSLRGDPAGGFVGAGVWYLIVVFIRYLAVVVPSRK